MGENNKEIGERIRKRRIALELTQAQLADLTGYQSKTSINKIELGKQGLRTPKIKVFADALETTPAYLMGWTDDPYDWDVDPDNRWAFYHENIPFWEVCLKRANNDEELARQYYDEGIDSFYDAAPETNGTSNNKSNTVMYDDLYAEKPNRIKVYGSVPAGIPLEAVEDIIDWEDIPEEWLRGDKEYFGLVVEGYSMYPTYQPGDIIVCLKQPDCESGQDAVVYVNGYDATLKRVIKQPFGILLQPLNPDPQYEAHFYDYDDPDNPISILGVVVELRRKMNG